MKQTVPEDYMIKKITTKLPRLLSHKDLHNSISNISTNEIVGLAIIGILAVCGLYYGWRLFWFLTDDAFIAFRYVSNSLLGYGYVWNPPPFRPVEGYTSFLWVFLLDIVWRISGIMPPISANWISLLFSSCTLILGIIMCFRLDWKASFRKYRLIFVFLFVTALLTNRTFLAWTSSGLETAMFTFFLLYWVFSNFYLVPASRAWVWNVSISATLLALTRPDGYLIAFGTGLMILIVMYRKRITKGTLRGEWLAILPLGIILLHLLWRKWTYGELLPNTFYAKSAPNFIWVKSGMYYLLSFIIEYTFWFYIALTLFFAVQLFIRWRETTHRPKVILWISETSNLIKFIALMVLLLQFSYYTFLVGGDYFEYRIYDHLIFLLFLSALWLIDRISSRPLVALLLYVTFVVAAWPIPWTHWYFTRNMTNRSETRTLTVSLAKAIPEKLPATPNFVIAYLSYYDGLQAWLIGHYVCIRYQEHKVLWQHLVAYYPSREDGSLIQNNDFPVATQQAVGIISWMLPHVNIIDSLGLNDYVVARNPDLNPNMRMAHLRRPPEGYIECFQPNVVISKKEAYVRARTEPMTAAQIIFCENHYLQQIQSELQK